MAESGPRSGGSASGFEGLRTPLENRVSLTLSHSKLLTPERRSPSGKRSRNPKSFHLGNQSRALQSQPRRGPFGSPNNPVGLCQGLEDVFPLGVFQGHSIYRRAMPGGFIKLHCISKFIERSPQ